jgi:hypothetical protein
VLVSFGASVSDLQIAVSDTDNALGTWKSTKFTGFAGLPGVGQGTADYPTLAMDKNAVYIGTNNFAPTVAGGSSTYRGTTLNVIPINSLFNATAPSTANLQQFVTPYVGGGANSDRGYAIQGVNSSSNGTSGKIFAASALSGGGGGGYDYYQGSIAVNSAGKVVIGYNRSGLNVATGKVSVMAQVFDTDASGALVATSSELLLKESLTDDYHNGAINGLAAVGRQRWGDYSQVSVDPTNENDFYLIGEFAREYNDAANGHPGGTGGSRWGTWVAMLDVSAVPEPSTWLSMALGLGVVGSLARRRKDTTAAA